VAVFGTSGAGFGGCGARKSMLYSLVRITKINIAKSDD
jgi:hypothetical protein